MKFKKIYIELSDSCGLKCSFCPSIKDRRGIMPLDLFYKIVQDCSKYTKLITFHMLGDPLKINNLKEYLCIANDYKLDVEITTSGVYLNEFDFLLKSPVKQINFSLDAVMGIESKLLRDKIFHKIFKFCKYKNPNSDIFINLRIQNDENHENIELINILKKEFNLLELNKNTRVGKKIIIVFRKSFLWNPVQNISFDEITINGFCYGLISHFGILANGVVVPCCIDVNENIILGDLKSQTLHEVLHDKRAQKIRNGFKNGFITNSFCLKCNYRLQFYHKTATK